MSTKKKSASKISEDIPIFLTDETAESSAAYAMLAVAGIRTAWMPIEEPGPAPILFALRGTYYGIDRIKTFIEETQPVPRENLARTQNT